MPYAYYYVDCEANTNVESALKRAVNSFRAALPTVNFNSHPLSRTADLNTSACDAGNSKTTLEAGVAESYKTAVMFSL